MLMKNITRKRVATPEFPATSATLCFLWNSVALIPAPSALDSLFKSVTLFTSITVGGRSKESLPRRSVAVFI